MPLMIVGTIRLPPERLAAALPVMAAMVAASRAEDGCLDYAYARDLFDHGLIRVSECWRDRAALDRHFASAHIGTWRTEWPRLGIYDRSLSLYDAGEAVPV